MIWRGGCIIRSVFLERIMQAYTADPALKNLMISNFFKKDIEHGQQSLRDTVCLAANAGVSVPSMSSALAYFDAYRTARLPANLLQGQRDYFGAHQYERTDAPRGEFFHHNWTGRGGSTASSTYTV